VKHKILLVGATGVFGERLARRLARWPDLDLVLAARNEGRLSNLAAELGAGYAQFDRNAPDPQALRVFAVIDCSGPFQSSHYTLPAMAVKAGAHYIDIADARDFVAGFEAELTPLATDCAAVTGASSTPALSNAALDAITAGWTRIDSVTAGISPGARAPRGLSVVKAILSWAGQPLRVFHEGAWRNEPGWSLTRRTVILGVGRRWLSLAETPDLDILPARFSPRDEALFLAGIEPPLLHLGLAAAAAPVRYGALRSLAPLARPFRFLAGVLTPFGGAMGGMIVQARGADSVGEALAAQWSLSVAGELGPHIPTLAAAAVLKALIEGRWPPGARTCAGQLRLGDILAEAKDLPIETRTMARYPEERSLFRRLMGPAFDTLPEPVRRVHHGRSTEVFKGRALARGSGALPARLARAFAGIELGRFPAFKVTIAPGGAGESWRRAFGARFFQSRIVDEPDVIGRFSECVGPLTFVMEARPDATGFRWAPVGWKLGRLPLPAALAPRIRARSFERGGVYHFQVCISHRLFGVIVAYAGRLTPNSANR
jgi:hypothetical protein